MSNQLADNIADKLANIDLDSDEGNRLLKRWAAANGLKPSKMTEAELIEAYQAQNGNGQVAQPVAAPKLAPVEAPVSDAEQSDVEKAVRDLMAVIASQQAAQPASMDEERVVELIREHSLAPHIHKVELVREGQAVEFDEQVHPEFDTMLLTLAAGCMPYLAGPAGSGKTYAAEQAARALELPFYYMGAVIDRVEYLGFIDAGGEYQATAFRQAWEHGGVFLFDEFDGSLANEALPLNAIFAGAKVMPFPDGMVKRHPDFRVIVAANTYGRGADRQYVGRYQLDAATLSRFCMIDWEYDAAIEQAMAGGNADWLRKVQRVRDAIEVLALRHLVTPRATANGVALIAQGIPEAKVANMVIWQGMSAEDRAKVERKAGVQF